MDASQNDVYHSQCKKYSENQDTSVCDASILRYVQVFRVTSGRFYKIYVIIKEISSVYQAFLIMYNDSSLQVCDF